MTETVNMFDISHPLRPYIGELQDSQRSYDPSSGRLIMPANATCLPVPSVGLNEIACWSGLKWVLEDDFRGEKYWLADGTLIEINDIGVKVPNGALLTEPEPEPEPSLELTFEELLLVAIANREAAYKAESDSLYIEWQYDQSDEGEEKWRAKVLEIKERYPLPIE
jgi:hypothetical protein